MFGLEVRLGGGVFGLEEAHVWLRGASGRVFGGGVRLRAASWRE